MPAFPPLFINCQTSPYSLFPPPPMIHLTLITTTVLPEGIINIYSNGSRMFNKLKLTHNIYLNEKQMSKLYEVFLDMAI